MTKRNFSEVSKNKLFQNLRRQFLTYFYKKFNKNMRNILFLFFLIFFIPLQSIAIDFSVPDSISKELRTSQIKYNERIWTFKIYYPPNFSPLRVHPVVLVLSGGNASEKIADYTYRSLFRTKAFKGFIKIFPLAPEGMTLKDLDSSEIVDFIYIIKDSEFFKNTHWFLAGISSGGIAAFNFARFAPERFREIMVMPGAPSFDSIPSAWKNYNVLLAWGENDTLWKKASLKTSEMLQSKVNKVLTYELEGIGHIIPQQYNIDSIYMDFFEKCYPGWNKKLPDKIALGEIKSSGLELLIDEKILKIYMAEEIGKDAFIKKILIQRDEEGDFFLYGEGSKGEENLIMKVSLTFQEKKLLLTLHSVLEYCITEGGCPQPVFSITGRCQCSRQSAGQAVNFHRQEGIQPGNAGLGALFH